MIVNASGDHMQCKKCGVWVDSLKRIHRCKKKKVELPDETVATTLVCRGTCREQDQYWWNWINSHGEDERA
jgi:chemotaxis signal transduction protein